MAIYHYVAQIIKRSQGRSAIAAAAYRAGMELWDERTGIWHDYSRKTGIVFTQVLAPANAPDWVYNREQLWNQVEKSEKRRDSQLAREVNVALPLELSLEQTLELLDGFIKEQFIERGMIADYAVHLNPGNPHAHIMLTMRSISAGEFGQKNREWNDKAVLEWQRERWAHHTNEALAKAGFADVKIDHRSLKDQGIEDRLPQIHLGVVVKGMMEKAEQRGEEIYHPRLERFNEIAHQNQVLRELHRELAEVDEAIAHENQLFTVREEREQLHIATEGMRLEPVRLEQEHLEQEWQDSLQQEQLRQDTLRQEELQQRWGEDASRLAAKLWMMKQGDLKGGGYSVQFDVAAATLTLSDQEGILVRREGQRVMTSPRLTEQHLKELDRAKAELLMQQVETGSNGKPNPKSELGR